MIRSEVVIRFEQLYDSIRSIMDLEAREERNISDRGFCILDYVDDLSLPLSFSLRKWICNIWDSSG